MKKSTVILMVIVLFSFRSYSNWPDNDKNNKGQRAVKRTHKEQLLLKQKEELMLDIQSMEWSISASSLKSDGGRINKLDPTNNYIQINGRNASIQLNSKNGENYNNSNVISIVGEIENFDIEESDNPLAPLYISMQITNEILSSAMINIYINAKGNAIVDIYPSTGENSSINGVFTPI